MDNRRRKAILATIALLVGISAHSDPVWAVDDALAIRVGDAVGVPGGTIAIVLRTYASRPIGQGQLCLRAPAPTPVDRPMAAVPSAEVFSASDDASSGLTVLLEQDPQAIVLEFGSPSATINADDGPLAVFFVQLEETVSPGEVFELQLDLENSSLLDQNGQPIPILPRNGRLRIRAPDEPLDVTASAEKTFPGGIALLSFQTKEPFPISSGRVGFQYDTAIAAGLPVVSMDPRYGASSFSVDLTTPGRVVVDFLSWDNSLNSIPGDLVTVRIPTLVTVLPGTLSPVSLDPDQTFLRDEHGVERNLAIGDDLLEFRDPVQVSLGTASDLAIRRLPGDLILLTWGQNCGDGPAFSIYRGDLGLGYSSLAMEPGFCSISGTSATVSGGGGTADFFLVVPNGNGFEGSYGANSSGVLRLPGGTVCYPQGTVAACAP